MNNIKFSKSIVKWFSKHGFALTTIGFRGSYIIYSNSPFLHRILVYKDKITINGFEMKNVSTEDFFKMYGGKYVFYYEYYKIPSDLLELELELSL